MKKNRREGGFAEQRKRNYDTQAALIPVLPFKQRHARVFMTLALLLSDIFSLLLAYGIAVMLRIRFVGDTTFLQFWNVIPILVFFLLVYAMFNLYPGIGLGPVREMKQLLSATNIVFLLLIAVTFWEQTSSNYSRFMLLATWLMALVLVQGARWLTRIISRKLGFWGEPVAVVGNGPEGQHIVKFLTDHIRLGMRPVLSIDGQSEYEDTPLVAINRSNIRTLILVTTEMSIEMQKRLINDQRFGYHRRRGEKYIPKLILISPLGWVGSMGILPIDMDGFLGLEVQQNLLNKWPNLFKRLIDLTLTFTFGFISAPFLLIIMALICLDSPGGVFYRQKRVGRNGRIFKMWKFRTMRVDADQIFQSLLDSDPAKRIEWEKNQKLKIDPRITRMGMFLRKFSLDEIPQLINVVKGEMSLVGPRPYFPEQQEIYGEGIKLYNRVRPGMTGMWQVRGRNTTSFKERARLDEYYIRNWSFWLDIYILVRTIREVLAHEGAY
jgi:Undecaprenyl-phosphate galactose phosphotransferase WbaP